MARKTGKNQSDIHLNCRYNFDSSEGGNLTSYDVKSNFSEFLDSGQ